MNDAVQFGYQAAMLALDPTGDGAGEALDQLVSVHRQLSDLLREMPATAAPGLLRLGLVGALRQVVEGEWKGAFDDVTWRVAPEAEAELKRVPPLTAEVLYYAAREAVRNAARHGHDRELDCPLHLQIEVGVGDGVEIVVEDDGRGMEHESSSPEPGRGLALHSTMMAVIGGSLSIESRPGAYTRVRLTLPGDAE